MSYFDPDHPTHPHLETEGPHRFRVLRPQPPQWDGDDGYPYYGVQLPHQCDAWEIAGDCRTPAEAATALEGLIAEAQQALALLRQLPEEPATEGTANS